MTRSTHRRTAKPQHNVRRTAQSETVPELDLLSDDDLEEILFDEHSAGRQGPFNFPTMAGLSIMLIGLLYLMQKMNVLSGLSLDGLVALLPWIAGFFILLLGFGIFSRRPRRPSKRKLRKQLRREVEQYTQYTASGQPAERRLTKSLHRKVAGVCAGLAEYFGFSTTYTRVAFIIGTCLLGVIGPVFPIAYAVLAFVLPRHKDDQGDK